MDKVRINWLDSSRGLAFLMVIYHHITLCNEDLMRYFLPIFLTIFFFVSGYLSKDTTSFYKTLEQRTRTLLIPFLLGGLVLILLSQTFSFREQISFKDAILGLILQNGENEILWFIGALYAYSLIFYWIEKLSKTRSRLLIFITVLFISNVIYTYWLHGPSLPWHLSQAFFACFYMGLGKIYKSIESKVDKIITLPILLIALVFYIASITIFNLHISFFGSKYAIDSLALTIIGLTLLVYTSKRYLSNSRFLLFVGTNTLLYFIFHGKVFTIIEFATYKTLDILHIQASLGLSFVLGIIVTLLTAITLIPIAMLINRYFSFALGKGFKLWNT